MEKQNNVRVAITGGSGFIGTNVVDYCLRNNIRCINLDIKKPNKELHKPLWHQVDVRNESSFFECLNLYKPTHVLHLAATTGMDVADPEFFNTNTEGVKNLISIGKKLSSISRMIFTSSLLVCQNGYIPKSDTDYCPPNLYGRSKMIGEQLLREAHDLPFKWAIIRPTSIWGPWFEHSYRAFFKVLNDGFYFHPGKKLIIKPASYVGNAVFMIFKLLFCSEELISGQTFYLADYPAHSTRQWAEVIHKQLNKNSSIKTIPVPLLKIAALLCDFLKKCGIKELPLSSFRLKNMLTGGIYPTANTERVVGPLPISLEEGVKETIAWMKEYGYL